MTHETIPTNNIIVKSNPETKENTLNENENSLQNNNNDDIENQPILSDHDETESQQNDNNNNPIKSLNVCLVFVKLQSYSFLH